MVMARVPKERAVKAVKRWWRLPLIAWDVRQESRITTCIIKYVPFWKITSNAHGFVEGYRTAEDDVYYHRKVDRNYVCNIVACDAADIGIKQLKRLQGDILPYDLSPEQIREATVSRREACYTCESAMEKEAARAAKMSFPVSTSIGTSPIGRVLIFYPLWIIEYAYGGEMYRATIDGVSGRVIAGRAPGEHMMKNMAPGISLAALVFVAGLGFFILTANSYIVCFSIITIIITMIFCAMIVMETYEYNNSGSIVVKGDYKDGYKPFRYLERMRRKAGWDIAKVKEVDIAVLN